MVQVLFLQLPPPRFSFTEPPTNIPLAAGFLAEAVKASGSRLFQPRILEPDIADVFGDEGLAARIALRRPAVLALTLYVWNVQRSLFLASNVKRRAPEVKVLVGGPEVTPDNVWVQEHPAVDAGVFGEGESRIVQSLKALLGQGPTRTLTGAFFKDPGEFRVNLDPAPPWDLSRCPYPYMNGTIGPSRDGTLFLETVRGCPFRCRYCYYHKAYGKIRPHPKDTVRRVLELAYDKASAVREIYLMDPTFNSGKLFRDLLKEIAGLRTHKEIALHAELRADLLGREDVTLLREAGLVSAEVGLQSINPGALRQAGRKTDPQGTARGVALLKEAGIDVTTGIILGLPGDTPQWFRRTISWLKETGAYSVVHPFVLAVLPGTDFRFNAARLGLKYDSRPPYYVQSTPTFPQEEFAPALLECENVLDMELDYISPPSLVDAGPAVIEDPRQAPYISKWIVDPGRSSCLEIQGEVWPRATDPFTLWFRGVNDGTACANMLKLMEGFVSSNPNGTLHVVFETRKPPEIPFLQRALNLAVQPGLFLNRAYRPLYSGDEAVTPRFWVILTYVSDVAAKRRVEKKYHSSAEVIWDWSGLLESAPQSGVSPVLISLVHGHGKQCFGRLAQDLINSHGDTPEEVLFRDGHLEALWKKRTRGLDAEAGFREIILVDDSAKLTLNS